MDELVVADLERWFGVEEFELEDEELPIVYLESGLREMMGSVRVKGRWSLLS